VKTGCDYSLQGVRIKLNYDLEYCNHGNLLSYFKIMFIILFKTVIGKIKN